jgi:C1A family cysteine protease
MYSLEVYPNEKQERLPVSVDLSPRCPAIYDQGQLGSCTANAIAGAMEFDQMKQNLVVYPPSRLFIYFQERKTEGTIAKDAGAQIRDGIKVVASIGAPPENLWPYDILKFTEAPPALACDAAALDRSVSYYRLDPQNLDHLKTSLAAGYPFVVGIQVYPSFAEAEFTGIIPMPSPGEKSEGGHAILFVGYDDNAKVLKFRNSWGSTWGQSGYGLLPYDYFKATASDCWTIRTMTLTASAEKIDEDEEAA